MYYNMAGCPIGDTDSDTWTVAVIWDWFSTFQLCFLLSRKIVHGLFMHWFFFQHHQILEHNFSSFVVIKHLDENSISPTNFVTFLHAFGPHN